MRTQLQTELTDFYGEDVMRVIERWRSARISYRRMSGMIYDDTGYRVKPATIARWAAYERNGR